MIHRIAWVADLDLRCALLVLVLLGSGVSAAGEVPRVVLGLHDSPRNAAADTTYLYNLAEMPLNHLGLKLEYHNLRLGVPSLGKRSDVRGLLIWLNDGRGLPLQRLTDLVREAVRQGVPVVFVGNIPSGHDDRGKAISLEDQNRLLELAGVRTSGGYSPYTYNLKVAVKVSSLVEFERKLPLPPPATETVAPVSALAQTLLAFDRPGDEAARLHAVMLTPQGGYVAAGYTHYEDKNGGSQQWYLNPFAFFAKAFRTHGTPIADTTTIAGRRIFYSHIDGDGWGSVSTADKYAGRGVYAAEVILREVAKTYPALPVTVAPIAADIDPVWAGTLKSQQIARGLFALPNVEPATHTYTHPFEWAYFGLGYRAAHELTYVKKYSRVRIVPGILPLSKRETVKLKAEYDAPRAYGDIPFTLKREIEASTAYINSFCPPGKRVRLLQWSGDTSPSEETIDAVMKSGLLNLNARDTRFDGVAPSYSAVSPVGKRAGKHMQVSASHANENVYTDLWKSRFFGFRFLKTSLANTERPIRVKPINVYYHMYSGEKQASLTALKEVLDYVSVQEIAPITASHFAAIGQGFYSVKLVETAPQAWRVENRGALNTLRFDAADKLDVDYDRSAGVLGSRLNGDVLYVALDSAVKTPILALSENLNTGLQAPRLVDSRWVISGLNTGHNAASFNALGFGAGEMTWRVSPSAAREQWEARLDSGPWVTAVVDAKGLVEFRLPSGAENGVRVTIKRTNLRPALL